ncbi:MAG: ADP-forming succinate--CoA ligase subunit beta [Candidatus Saccharicenans sp.]|nr:ADP-forming succinate--CoA ligase subunit beta [Candidatus Saccharicenans sp.]
MLIHEFQAKDFLRRLGWGVPEGSLAETVEEVKRLAGELGCPVILKAQVLAGGRGKAGGILKALRPEEAAHLANRLLGSKLVTAQTGSQGLTINKLLVEKAVSPKKELYCALAVDRRNENLVAIVSQQGGLDIEELSRFRPQLIKKIYFEPDEGLKNFQARQLAYFLELTESLVKDFVARLKLLAGFFIEKDLKLLEINPLALTEDNRLVALDARIEFDDCSLARHPEIASLRDESQENELEKRARKFGLNYIKMDGSIGCLVNGAGLAMATMDIIKHFGGQPANFLDIGGGVTEEAVSQAFELLLADTQVVSGLINIFGGIVRCDLVARGVVTAASRLSLNRPVVVRLEGTNVNEGRRILEESGLPFIFASDFEQAARLAVELSGQPR